ncbi:transcription factor [Elasticomyces elasticus]|nr:transcription factor [Elasticomyces elasticus]
MIDPYFDMNANGNESEDANDMALPHDEPLPCWAHLRMKRSHKKSRSGCVTCKQRRVKCDETKPRCQKCLSRGIACRYASSKERSTQKKAHDLSAVCLRASPARVMVKSEVPTLDLPAVAQRAPDALLWQYYLVHASKTMTATSTDRAHAQMWESSVPAVAFNHPVASHAVMAFSALCMYTTSSTKGGSYELLATAKLHYCRSLQLLGASLPVTEEISVDAVLACAMTLIPVGLTLAQFNTGITAAGDKLAITPQLDWLYHLRGWRTLGSSIAPRLADSDTLLIPFPQPGIPESDHEDNYGGGALWTLSTSLFHTLRASWRDALANLSAAIANPDNPDLHRDAVDIEACTMAITALEYVMEYTLECRVSNFFRAVFAWPSKVPQRFFDMVTSLDHLALAIHAHWLVLTMLLEDLWWVKDFGADRIERLAIWYDRVESPYAHLLSWPVEVRKDWRSLGMKIRTH